jgi:hypothetical protein
MWRQLRCPAVLQVNTHRNHWVHPTWNMDPATHSTPPNPVVPTYSFHCTEVFQPSLFLAVYFNFALRPTSASFNHFLPPPPTKCPWII